MFEDFCLPEKLFDKNGFVDTMFSIHDLFQLFLI